MSEESDDPGDINNLIVHKLQWCSQGTLFMLTTLICYLLIIMLFIWGSKSLQSSRTLLEY